MQHQANLSNFTGNLLPGETADLVVLLGPRHIATYKNLSEACKELESTGFKYLIVGDGEQVVTMEDIEKLPKTKYLFINGHGRVFVENDEPVHKMQFGTLSRDPREYDISRNIIVAAQRQTGAKNIVVLSCYSGKLNEEIARDRFVDDGTILITTADAAQPCYSRDQIVDFAGWICSDEKKEKNFAEYFGYLIASYPETISFAKLIGDYFHPCVVKTAARGAFNSVETGLWVAFNTRRFNSYLSAMQVDPVFIPPFDPDSYYLRSILYHFAHFDGLYIEKLLMSDPEVLQKINHSPFEVVFANLGYFQGEWDAQKRDELKLLLTILFETIPNGLESGFAEFEKLKNAWPARRQRAVLTILLEIAESADNTREYLERLLKIYNADDLFSYAAGSRLVKVVQYFGSFVRLDERMSYFQDMLKRELDKAEAEELFNQILSLHEIFAEKYYNDPSDKDAEAKHVQSAEFLQTASAKVDVFDVVHVPKPETKEMPTTATPVQINIAKDLLEHAATLVETKEFGAALILFSEAEKLLANKPGAEKMIQEIQALIIKCEDEKSNAEQEARRHLLSQLDDLGKWLNQHSSVKSWLGFYAGTDTDTVSKLKNLMSEFTNLKDMDHRKIKRFHGKVINLLESIIKDKNINRNEVEFYFEALKRLKNTESSRPVVVAKK